MSLDSDRLKERKEDRKAGFKTAFNKKAHDKKRDKVTVQLRKSKREDVLNKKRFKKGGGDSIGIADDEEKEFKGLGTADIKGSKLDAQVKGLVDKFEKQQINEGVRLLNFLLSHADTLDQIDGGMSDVKKLIQLVIERKWYEPLSQMLMSDKVDINIRVTISAIFANITGGCLDQDMYLINKGSILLVLGAALAKYKEHKGILDNLLFALDNIVNSEDPQMTLPRDLVVKNIGFKHILSVWRPTTDTLITSRLLELFLDMLRRPRLPFNESKILVEPMVAFISNFKEEDLLYSSLLVLANLSGTPKYEVLSDDDIVARIHFVIQAGALGPLNALLKNPSPSVASKSMHVLSNLVGGRDEDAMAVLKSGGILETITRMVTREADRRLAVQSCGTKEGVPPDMAMLIGLPEMNTHLLKEACWLLSNCVLSSSDIPNNHSRTVIDELIRLKLLEPLLLLSIHAHLNAQYDIAVFINNWVSSLSIADKDDAKRVEYLLRVNIDTNRRPSLLAVLCSFLHFSDTKMQHEVLRTLLALVKHDVRMHKSTDDPTYVVNSIEENGGIEVISELQQSEHDDVRDIAIQLTEGYLSPDQREMDEEMTSITQQSQSQPFQFAFPAAQVSGGAGSHQVPFAF